MIINHNLNAMNAHRNMGMNTVNSGKSMEKLSSGLRINRAGDDAAGLAISEKMRGQIRGLDQASRNAQDGISLIQTAEGALNETHSILQRMRELAVQSSNGTNNSQDKGQIQKEMDQLTSEINRIGNTTEFNTMKLLNGERDGAVRTGSSTTVTNSIIAGTKDVFTALGITDGASSLDLASKVTIASSPGDGFDFSQVSANSGVSTVTIGKNANGQLEVSIKANSNDGLTAFSSIDKVDVNWDASGQMKFDSHGISFTIKKSDFEDASTTTTKVIDLFVAGGGTNVSGVAIDTSNSWTSNTLGAKIGSGITIAAGALNGFEGKAASIEINISGQTGDAKVNKLNVKVLDASGNVLMSDVMSGINANSASYNNNGISFTVDSLSTSSTSAKLEFKLDDFKKTTSETKYTTKDDSLTFQVGANKDQSMAVGISDMRANALGLTSKTATAGFASSMTVTNGTNNVAEEYSINVKSYEDANKAIETLQAAIDKVSDERSKLGAYQNRLEHTINNLGTSSENLQASESRIRDVDMAKEMMAFSKNNILAQAAQSMLAQANQQPQQVLQLLR